MSRMTTSRPAFGDILAGDPVLGPRSLLVAVIEATFAMDVQHAIATGGFDVTTCRPDALVVAPTRRRDDAAA